MSTPPLYRCSGAKIASLGAKTGTVFPYTNYKVDTIEAMRPSGGAKVEEGDMMPTDGPSAS